MGIKQKIMFDAGVATPKDLYEINDQGGRLTSVPLTPGHIVETVNMVFTYNMGVIGGQREKNLSIADGERRPGSRR
jgi:hypothetical protein